MSTPPSKSHYRARWKRQASVDPEHWRRVGEAICRLLRPHVKGKLGLFHPLGPEPNLMGLWSPEGTFFPRVRGETMDFFRVDSLAELTKGYRGILEPPDDPARQVSWKAEDVMAVPGVYFDGQGGRLGRGKGYYDRYLAGFPGRKVGVCSAAQVLEDSLARETFDVRMDALCTELKWVPLDGK